MKEKQRIVDYLKELAEKIEKADFKVKCSVYVKPEFTKRYLEGMSICEKEISRRTSIDIDFNFNESLENQYEPKKGDFVVVDDGCILQLREDFTGGGVRIDGFGDFKVDKIREADQAEKEAKIEEFKSKGWICGEDGLWREPKLEEVYCVARSKADFIRVYSAEPEMVDWVNASIEMNCAYIKFGDEGVWNGFISNVAKVSIEKFIELLKKHKENE